MIFSAGNNNVNERVTEMLLEAPRLHANIIDQALSDDDILAIEAFEDKWRSFLYSNPGVLPPGKKLKSCLEIQTQLEEIEISKQMVQMELQRQLDFFAKSKDQLEANFTKAMEEAALIQQEVSRNMNKEIDDIAVADQLFTKTQPWEHFLDNLDFATDEHNVSDGYSSDSHSSGTISRGLKPSRQAMFLAGNIDQGQVAEAAMQEKSSALLLQTFKIDNALLKAETKMMQQEVDRLERTIKSQKFLGKFLTEHNIWALLKGGTGSTVAGAGTVAGKSQAGTFAVKTLKSGTTATAMPTTPKGVATAIASAFKLP
jgi:hypothetical protein